MVLTLISATPSPFARINRIAMLDKKIPFELQNEVPWDSTTKTPDFNPLEKLPILIFDDGREAIYDSAFIQNYITEMFPQEPTLLPAKLEDKLKARQIQILSEGIMDAVALSFFELGRGDTKSPEWFARQQRKIIGGVKALGKMAKEMKGDYLVGDTYTIADIAVVVVMTFVAFISDTIPLDYGDVKEWKTMFPELEKYRQRFEEMPNFKSTAPVMFEIKDKIV